MVEQEQEEGLGQGRLSHVLETMGNDHFEEEESPGRRRSVGPIVLLVPLAFSLLAVSFLKNPSPSELGPRARPPQHQLDERVEGWQGELALDDGLRWSATLKPLHSDASRQAFDSNALQQRFGLGAGQVYRLTLTEVSNSASAETLDLPLVAEELVVVDAEGQALSLLALREHEVPADPLRVLFAAPSQSLTAGSAASWILWGRAPGSNPRAAGFAGERELVLEARSFPREQVDVALVRRTQ